MVYQLTKFHVQRVDMVINPPWNLPFLGAKGLTSPEQTATVLDHAPFPDGQKDCTTPRVMGLIGERDIQSI
ncbi:hypothetical protein Tco_0488106 [Tanacetum coccineum]